MAVLIVCAFIFIHHGVVENQKKNNMTKKTRKNRRKCTSKGK